MNRGSTFFRLYRDQGRSRTARLARRTWVYPLALEKAYARAVAKYLRKSTEHAIADALTYYGGSHADAVDLGSGMEPAAGALLVIAKDLDKFNGKQWSMFQEIAVGSAWDEAEPWVQPTLERWARDQVTLIKNSQGTIQQYVSKRVRDAIRDGRTTAELKARLLKDLPGMSDRRAQLIARDQCAKLNGELAHGRMEDAGLETYIWETSMDERVRGREGGLYPDAVPSHWVMQGKVCRWDNPGVYRNDQGEWVARPDNAPTEHPGMAIQCRCVATPNWDELEDPSLDGQRMEEEPPVATQEPEPEQDDGLTFDASQWPDIDDWRAGVGDNQYNRTINSAKAQVEAMPRALRDAWLATANKVSITTERAGTDAAFFNPRDEMVHIGRRKTDTRTGCTLVHEQAHATAHRLAQERKVMTPGVTGKWMPRAPEVVYDISVHYNLGAAIRKDLADYLGSTLYKATAPADFVAEVKAEIKSQVRALVNARMGDWDELILSAVSQSRRGNHLLERLQDVVESSTGKRTAGPLDPAKFKLPWGKEWKEIGAPARKKLNALVAKLSAAEDVADLEPLFDHVAEMVFQSINQETWQAMATKSTASPFRKIMAELEEVRKTMASADDSGPSSWVLADWVGLSGHASIVRAHGLSYGPDWARTYGRLGYSVDIADNAALSVEGWAEMFSLAGSREGVAWMEKRLPSAWKLLKDILAGKV